MPRLRLQRVRLTVSTGLQFQSGLTVAIAAVLSALAFAPPSDAQIVNTLRRWSDVEPHLRHNYRLTPALSTLVFLQHSSDPFRRIDSRTLAGAGARIDLIREEDWEGSVGLSAMHESETFTDDPAGAR